jgi:hypothetical protein
MPLVTASRRLPKSLNGQNAAGVDAARARRRTRSSVPPISGVLAANGQSAWIVSREGAQYTSVYPWSNHGITVV